MYPHVASFTAISYMYLRNTYACNIPSNSQQVLTCLLTHGCNCLPDTHRRLEFRALGHGSRVGLCNIYGSIHLDLDDSRKRFNVRLNVHTTCTGLLFPLPF